MALADAGLSCCKFAAGLPDAVAGVKDPALNPLISYNYEYSPAGNVTAKNTDQGNYTYQYDDLYRLINATNASNEAYTYDAVGNRLTSADVQGNWSYNGNNQLLSYNGVSYEYDANGNITARQTRQVEQPTPTILIIVSFKSAIRNLQSTIIIMIPSAKDSGRK